MKKEESHINSESFNFSLTEEPQENYVIYDGIEFKQTSYKFMFEVPFFRCSRSINYFQIKSSDWTKFKANMQEMFTTDFLGCAKSLLLFITLPESIKQDSTILQKTNANFSIDQELKKRFGEAFFFTTSFISSQFCEAHIMLCDNAPTENDYIPEYHMGMGEPWDFFEICRLCQSPCPILHFCIQCPKNEINKLKEQAHNTINDSYLSNPSILTIIQLGLPSSALTEDELTIILESLGPFNSQRTFGIGASIIEDMIEANIYLILNPSRNKIFN